MSEDKSATDAGEEKEACPLCQLMKDDVCGYLFKEIKPFYEKIMQSSDYAEKYQLYTEVKPKLKKLDVCARKMPLIGPDGKGTAKPFYRCGNPPL